MNNTKSFLAGMLGMALVIACVFLWGLVTLKGSDFAWWGFALYLAPLVLAPLGVAIRADLRDRK